MSKFDRNLWNRFLAVAQPYFYPLEPGGGGIFLGLLLLLLIFLFAAMFVAVSIVTLGTEAIFGDAFNNIAPGLADNLRGIIQSEWIYLVVVMLIIPSIAFFFCRNKVIPRWQPWALLTLLLFLSLSVSGLNVIISYVGNFFTTALATKEEATYWRFLFVYAGVFIIGTPIVVIYVYMREKLGLYWREWMTHRFLDNYLENRAYYEINSAGVIDNPDQRISEDIKLFTPPKSVFSVNYTKCNYRCNFVFFNSVVNFNSAVDISDFLREYGYGSSSYFWAKTNTSKF